MAEQDSDIVNQMLTHSAREKLIAGLQSESSDNLVGNIKLILG